MLQSVSPSVYAVTEIERLVEIHPEEDLDPTLHGRPDEIAIVTVISTRYL